MTTKKSLRFEKSLRFPSGNKDAVAPNPLTREESRRVYKCKLMANAYQGQLNAGFSKICKIYLKFAAYTL